MSSPPCIVPRLHFPRWRRCLWYRAHALLLEMLYFLASGMPHSADAYLSSHSFHPFVDPLLLATLLNAHVPPSSGSAPCSAMSSSPCGDRAPVAPPLMLPLKYVSLGERFPQAVGSLAAHRWALLPAFFSGTSDCVAKLNLINLLHKLLSFLTSLSRSVKSPFI